MFIRRFAPIMAGVLLAVSCSLDVPNDAGSIVLYLEVDKATLPVDESLTVTATARNLGYDLLTLTGPSDCLIYIEIRDSGGQIIHSSNDGCSGSTVTEELEAGANKVMSFVWNGTTRVGSRAPSGLYVIRGVVRVTGSPYLGPPLTIAVE